MKNKYLEHAHVDERTFRQILRYFCLDIEAKKVAEITHISRQSINKLFYYFRIRIKEICDEDTICSDGEYELDESYFGARRVRGIRGRGAKGKTIVFGILKRGGNVSTFVVRDCKYSTLLPLIKQVISSNSTIYTDGYTTYQHLIDNGFSNHLTVNHNNNEFARNGKIHTNGIENFWGLCKSRLTKFRGIDKQTFILHIKECEFRYNHRHENLFNFLLKNFRKKPLKLS
ncbi:MAG: IS1595 family transposase [Clostridiales bacterium]|nr:IS1595 family transposase [Bacteroidales bacterium]MBP5427583.1 IS1595 family transposase [Clostridiales bacterium]MCR5554027.1 IS1595 family transposase [Bacteroidales bacterium]